MAHQSKTVLHIALIFAFAIWTSTADTIVSETYYNDTAGASLGTDNQTTYIDASVTVWLSGPSPHDVFGTVDNSGTIIFSQTNCTTVNSSGLMSDWQPYNSLPTKLINHDYALFQVNDVADESTSGSSQYLWLLEGMENNGTVQWCSNNPTESFAFGLICITEDCHNNADGVIVFESLPNRYFGEGEIGIANAQPNDEPANQHFYQDGAIIMRNSWLILFHDFQGSGCWVMDDNSTLVLTDNVGSYQDQANDASLFGQSIYFADNLSQLYISTGVMEENSTLGAEVIGFGTGNSFVFPTTVSNVTYDSSTGLVNVTFSSESETSFYISIGTGYDPKGFAWGPYEEILSQGQDIYHVTYNASDPFNAPPEVCLPIVQTCTPYSPAVTITETYPGSTTATSYGDGEGFGTVRILVPYPTTATSTVSTTTGDFSTTTTDSILTSSPTLTSLSSSSSSSLSSASSSSLSSSSASSSSSSSSSWSSESSSQSSTASSSTSSSTSSELESTTWTMTSASSPSSITTSATASSVSPSGSQSITSLSTCGPSNVPSPCPDCNDLVMTDSNNVPYNVNCGTEYTGTVITPALARRGPNGTTIGQCLQSCDSTPECVAVNYNTTSNSCTLLSCLVTVITGVDSTAFYRNDRQVSCSVSTSLITSTVTITTCSAQQNQATTTFFTTDVVTMCPGSQTCQAQW